MKILFKLLLSCCLLVLFVLGVAPTVLSTEWGKEKFIQAFNYVSKSSLKIEGLQVSWMGQQKIEKIEWRDAGGKLRLTCPKIEIDAPLSQMLFQHDVGHMKIEAPQITLVAKKKQERSLPPLEPMGFMPAQSRDGKEAKGPTLAYQPLFKLSCFDWIKYSGKLDVLQGNITFLSEKPELKFEKLDVHLSRMQKDELEIQTACEIVEKDFAGVVNITGAVTHMGTNLQDISLESKLQNFPIRSLDQIASVFQPQLEGFFIDLMGESLSAELKLKSSAETLAIDIDANSSQFSAYARTDSNQREISLHSPALFTWNLSPEVLKKLTGISSKQDVTAFVKIDRFLLPIANQQACAFQAELRTSEIVLEDGTIEPIVLSLSTENFQKGIFTAKLQSNQVSCEEILFSWKEGLALLKPATFSGNVAGTLSALEIPPNWEELSLSADLMLSVGKIDPLHAVFKCRSIQEISLILQNKHFDVALGGKLSTKERLFIIKDPVAFTYHLDALPSGLPALSAPADVRFSINPCSIPLSTSDLYKLRFQGKGEVKELAFKDHAVKDLAFSFEGKNKALHVQANGTVDASAFTCDLDMQEDAVNVKAQGTKLPTDFIALWVPKDIQPAALLGDTLTFELDAANNKVALKADSPNFTCDLAIKLKDDKLQLVEPGKASFKLSKESYAALEKWIGESPFEITDGTTLELNISELTLPTKASNGRFPSIVYDMQTMQLQGDCLVDKLSFVNKESKEVTLLNHLKVHLSQPSKKSPLAFQIHGSADQQGILSIQGQFDHVTSATSLNCNIQQFPTALVDVFTKSAFSCATIFGPTLNMTAMAKIQDSSGPIKMSLHSSNARASIDGVLTNGALTLNDTIYAQVTLSKELGKLLLKDISPLSDLAIKAESPLTLEIPKDDFSLPVLPFSLKTANVPHVKIELGKLLSENKGNLSDIVGILKLSSISKEKEVGIWFSPINLSLKGGIITSERTEVLIADAYQICSWGTIDLIQDNVDLVLGLTESCLKKAFKIQNLPETYVLQIPMTGPLNDVHVNTALATSKVAALILWQQQAKIGGLAGGSTGALIGEFLNKIGPIPDSDSKAPPASHPLPWEATATQLSNKTPANPESPKKKKHFKPEDKPLKQILKMVR